MSSMAELEARLREAESAVVAADGWLCDYMAACETGAHERTSAETQQCEDACVDARMARNEALLALLEARMREQGREVRRGGE